MSFTQTIVNFLMSILALTVNYGKTNTKKKKIVNFKTYDITIFFFHILNKSITKFWFSDLK